MQSQLRFCYVCFSYLKEYGPWTKEQTEEMRRRDLYEKERWGTYFMFLDWKAMREEKKKEREKRLGKWAEWQVCPDPIYFRPG